MKKEKTTKKVTLVSEAKIKEMTKELNTIEKKTENLLKIEDEKQYDKANEFLLTIKTKEKQLDTERKSITNPINESLDAVNNIYMPRIKKCKELQGVLKDAMSSYLREEQKKLDLEEERIRKEQEKKNANREKKGLEPIDFEDASDLVEVLDTRTETKSGKTSAKKEWKFKILDMKKIPNEYLEKTLVLALEEGLLDKIIKQAIKEGIREIQGVEIYEDFSINAYIKK